MADPATTLILGLGNTLLTDDGVGVYAARRARELLAPDEPMTVEEAEIAGFALLDLIEGYRRVVVIDAIVQPGEEPGKISQIDGLALEKSTHLVAGHQIDLPTALALMGQIGREAPREVTIVAVQVEDAHTVSDRPHARARRVIEHHHWVWTQLFAAQPVRLALASEV